VDVGFPTTLFMGWSKMKNAKLGPLWAALKKRIVFGTYKGFKARLRQQIF
jgi:hypothetical protein